MAEVSLANRATLGNMSPEFGSTAAIFPVDEVTIDYLRMTGRSDQQLALVEAYAGPGNGTTHPAKRPYSEYLELDLTDVVPSIAGPKRPRTASRSTTRRRCSWDIHNYVEENLRLRKPNSTRPWRRASPPAIRRHSHSRR